jgi:putative membrane protein insertion efficiency factor
MERIMRKVVCFPIYLYQYLLRPFLPAACRFYPSCSNYTLSAIEHYGILKGFYLASRRLLRCHPWSLGGFDPILPHGCSTSKDKEKS